MTVLDIKYNAEPTLKLFHRSNAFVRGIRGPVGSGKSTGCCAEIFRRSREQAPLKDKKRRTRFAIVRNTYRELEDTTLKTWTDWWPESVFGKINYNSMTHFLKYQDIECEVMFRALDKPKDVKKVLSLELTGAWINEAREVPFGIIEALIDRVGRYPAMKDGGPTWKGVLMDTNSPDDDHWWYGLSEKDKNVCEVLGIDLDDLKGWEFFTQPGGLIETSDGRFVPNPEAENTSNLVDGPDYYTIRAAGKSKAHKRIYYCNKYGFISEGKPVIPEYNDPIHFDPSITGPVPGLKIALGLDFGLTPAAVFGQELSFGKYIWFDELVTERMGAVNFSNELRTKINRDYPDFEIEEIWGDPAGNHEVETDEKTVFSVLNTHGIPAIPAPTNEFTPRREAIAVPLTTLIDGVPALRIGPKCKVVRKGLAGGFCFKRIQVAGEARYRNEPVKNKYSHPVEAGGYLMCGFGVGDRIVNGQPSDNIGYRPKR
ncbi:hypothetical protein [Desulfospira joergensenii]|uniref:hypothetical protein n=1 Tax=Desulfospira joergensenii TaxID=53329 RepID=UPI0003B5A4D0|nr:hypothetical protein [Desulfospira joergensenii]